MILSVADFQGPEKIPEDSVTGTRNQGVGYLLKLISNISKTHSVIFELTDVSCFYFENHLPCYLLHTNKHTTCGLKPAWILGLLVRGFFKLYQQAIFTSQPPEFIMNSYCSHLPGGSLLQNHCCSRASPEG